MLRGGRAGQREKLQHETAGMRHCSSAAADRRSDRQTERQIIKKELTSAQYSPRETEDMNAAQQTSWLIWYRDGDKSFGPSSYFSVAKKFIFPYLSFIWIGFKICLYYLLYCDLKYFYLILGQFGIYCCCCEMFEDGTDCHSEYEPVPDAAWREISTSH